MTIEKVSQDEMLRQFRERFTALVEDNKQMAAKIKENEVTALKLQGAIETLEYFGEGEVPDKVEDKTPETAE